MSQNAGILRNYFYSINYDQSILLLNNAGVGIDHEIMLRHITKLYTKPQTDMRLGLFYLKALLRELGEDLS